MVSENNTKKDLSAELIVLKKRVEDLEQSENRLRQEKGALESLISNSLDCIVQSDAKGIITYVNRAFIEMTGFKKEDILGKTPNFLAPVSEGEYESVTGEKIMFDKKFFDRNKKATAGLFKDGHINNLKTAVLRKDRKVVPVEENIFLLYGRNKEIIGSAAIIRDITVRERAEAELKKHRDNLDGLVIERTKELRKREHQLSEANARLLANDQELKSANEQLAASNQQLLASENSLRESEKNFRRLVETMNEGLIVMDDAGGISYVNEKLCMMTGYGRDELEGRTIDGFIDLEDERSRVVMEVVLSPGGAVNSGSYELEWIKKDKQKVPVIISPESIIDEVSGFVGNFAVVTDITFIKQAESSVRESRDFLENIFRTTRDAIIITDVSGTIQRVNQSVERVFGFTREEMVNKYLTEFIPKGEKYRIVGRGFAEELRDKGFLDIFETFFMKKNGEIAPFECNISLLRNEAGEASGAVVLLRDITERKKLEQQFLQTEKLSSLGELAGGVAHDFNNVLSAVLGRAQLLMRSIDKAKEKGVSEKLLGEIVESLKVIEKASLDGADTVHRIMKFARKEKDSEFGRVNINDVINDALEFTRPRWKGQAEAKGISVEINKDLSSLLPYVSGNASELREVITNILNNALDAMPAGGKVMIRSKLKDRFVLIDISDTGKGISQDVIDRIFDPFFTTKGPRSTGLGMSVSYGIIDQHGGTITVSSRKGEKTVFTLKLPLNDESFEGKDFSPADTVQKTINILIIEDEKAVCDVFEEMLENEGHEVDIAYDGKQGLAIFQKKKFDLVITDLAMPGMSGWQVAAAVKKIDKKMPVILTTGWELKSLENKEDKKNVDIIVKKPFTVSSMSEAIREVLKKRNGFL